MSHASLSLLQGTVDLLILRALQTGPAHGYAVSRWVRERTDGVLSMEDAALYQALYRLEARGWVVAEWGLSENNRRARVDRGLERRHRLALWAEELARDTRLGWRLIRASSSSSSRIGSSRCPASGRRRRRGSASSRTRATAATCTCKATIAGRMRTSTSGSTRSAPHTSRRSA